MRFFRAGILEGRDGAGGAASAFAALGADLAAFRAGFLRDGAEDWVSRVSP